MERFKNIILSLAVTIALFGLINVIALFWAKNYYSNLDMVSKNTQQKSYGYFLPNQSKKILFPGLKPYHARINTLGFRNVGLPMTHADLSSKTKILTVGDSLTFGLFVDDEASYPFLLQQELIKKNKNAIVLNAGIGSTTITDHLAYLKLRGLSVKPDIVVINFCSNDISELKNQTQTLYEKLLSHKDAGGIKNANSLPIFRAFRRGYVVNKYNHWMHKIKDEKIRNILTTQSRSLNDVLFVSKNYFAADIIKTPNDPEVLKGWTKYFKTLDETITLLHSQNIKIVFFIVPEILSVYDQYDHGYQEKLKTFLQERKIDYIDLSDEFKKYQGDKLTLFNNPPRDYHLSKTGNQIFVDKLLEIILPNIK
ncbi:MAG: SGNH/GDSL hydrolase family protein [Candidatus Omnitrophica bacterium]|nr:SGNH/GDSL hydrolase family protein [Candidatus Omnitrophota bacterium]